MTKKYNYLQTEESLYLKDHSQNPVNWRAWNEESFLKATEEDKPIFLSIGYSACHWCHIMNAESFNDEITAEYINEHFIPIKVDKEEFPDVDDYYQISCQLFSQRGGWPLSVFLLPNLKPFFAGTYFPKNAQEGQTNFMQVLEQMNTLFHNEREKIETNAKTVDAQILSGTPVGEKVEYHGHFPHPQAILNALKQYQDNENGGFGPAPKFPQFALYEWASEQIIEGMIEKDSLDHLISSIDALSSGGIIDHVRGGIHRYAVDEKWSVPHFEKMLYDQAGLLRLFAKCSLYNPTPLIFDQLIKTLDYLETEMLCEDGYFFASQDADSEGIEGLYYSYTEEEFECALNNQDNEDETLNKNIDNIKKWLGITSKGNFEKKLNVISLQREYSSEYFQQENWQIIRKTFEALLEERKTRIPPKTDRKGIASWNFMILSALCDTIQYCPVDVIKQRAWGLLNKSIEGCFKTFIIAKDQGSMVLRHTTTQDKTFPYFEDYVFFMEAQLRIHEVSGNGLFLDNALDCYNFIIKNFLKENKFYTRPLSLNEHTQLSNIPQVLFCQSFRSPLATFLLQARRLACATENNSLIDPLKIIMEEAPHIALKNPLGFPEALRALTYPKEAFKVVEVPPDFAKQREFSNFQGYFMPRFVFNYKKMENEEWQICSSTGCELHDNGLKSFIAALSPAEEKKEE